jgi:hypothetical protein
MPAADIVMEVETGGGTIVNLAVPFRVEVRECGGRHWDVGGGRELPGGV